MDLVPPHQGWQPPLLPVGPRLKSAAWEQSSMDRSMKVLLTSSDVFHIHPPGYQAGGLCAMMGTCSLPLFQSCLCCA